MNICVVASDFYPSVGGMEQHVQEIYEQMARLGHSVRVINLNRFPIPNPVSKLGSLDVTQQSLPIHKMGLNIFHYWKTLRTLIEEEYRTQPFEVIHWHDLYAGVPIRQFSADKKHLLKVFTNHSSGYLRLRSKTIVKQYFRYSINHADLLIAPSQELLDCSQEDFSTSLQYAYIPNGVDQERYLPKEKDSSWLEKAKLTVEHSVIFCPRRLAPKNGVFFLVQALPEIVKSCPQAVLMIAGEGEPPEEERRIKAQVAKDGMESHIRFLGKINNQDMPVLYNLADVVAMPSLMEAVSLAALEAMASGKAVVASDVGGLSELFADPHRGKLVPPATPSALAQAVIDLLQDDPARQTMGDVARDYVLKNYTWAQIAKRALAAYEKVRV